jgi:hypothetical protein
MSKPRYNVGTLIAADNDEENPKPIIGWIYNVQCSKIYPDMFVYLVEWADGVTDNYTEKHIETYIKLYKKLKRRKNP